MMRSLFEPEPHGIGIVGSRRRNTSEDLSLVREAFSRVYEPGDFVVSGGCKKGGDRFAEIIAAEFGIRESMLIHLPDQSLIDPDKHPRYEYGRVCKLRNTLIARDSSKVLIACVALDRTGGTEDTIKKHERFYPYGMRIYV